MDGVKGFTVQELTDSMNEFARLYVPPVWKPHPRVEQAIHDWNARNLKRDIRKFLDQRGYKGEERRQWWAELRRLAREKHGITL